MSNLIKESIVSPSEAEALKEMIFKRARERAESMTQSVDKDFTASIRNDVMNMARNSFVSSKNPFSQQTEEEPEKKVPEEAKTSFDFVVDAKVEAAKLKIQNIKSQIQQNTFSTQDEILKTTLNTTMADARKSLDKKQSFMDALNFLNSQASLSLIQNNASRFEAVA